jgi:hypothetical protein
MSGAPIDQGAATDFLIRVHKDITTGAVRLVSFANADRKGSAKRLFAGDPPEVEDHCRKGIGSAAHVGVEVLAELSNWRRYDLAEHVRAAAPEHHVGLRSTQLRPKKWAARLEEIVGARQKPSSITPPRASARA